MVDTITGEKSLGCISMAPVFPERDIGEGFEECFNILVKRANTRGEYRIGSQKGFADTNKLNVACVVQNGNKLLDNKNPSPMIAVMVKAEGIFRNLTSLIYWQTDNTL